ncbi:MAG: hypothetical protein Tsb009_17220 [Planctomycetaceae bacterium]
MRPEFDVLFQRYQQVLRRCGNIARRECCREVDHSFRASILDLVTKLKPISSEFEKFRSGCKVFAGPNELRQRLQTIDDQSTQLEQRAIAFDQLREKLFLIDSAFMQLWNGCRVSSEPFLKLVERIRCETANQKISSALFVLDPISQFAKLPQAKLSRSLHSRDPVYRQGIASACVLSALWPTMRLPYRDVESLLLGALLQDIGFVALERRYSCLPSELAESKASAFRRHPRWSAAMCSGLKRCSVDVPMLVGQHHERLNGIGFPQGLRGHRLSMASRFLQIVSCFVEMVHEKLVKVEHHDFQSILPLLSAIRDAAEFILNRARYGEFDVSLAERFSSQILAETEISEFREADNFNRIHSEAGFRDSFESFENSTSPETEDSSPTAKNDESSLSGTIPTPKFIRRSKFREAASMSSPPSDSN